MRAPRRTTCRNVKTCEREAPQTLCAAKAMDSAPHARFRRKVLAMLFPYREIVAVGL